MKNERSLSILMIMVLLFTSFVQPLVIFGEEVSSFDEDVEEMFLDGEEAIVEMNEELEEPKVEEEPVAEEVEVEIGQEKEPVKNKGDPVKKKQEKGTPENEVAKEVKKHGSNVLTAQLPESLRPVKDVEGEREVAVGSDLEVVNKIGSLNNVEEKHVSDMTDDERDSLKYAIDSSLSRFITKSYITPLKDENATYVGKVRYEYEIPDGEKISANTKYIIPTYNRELRKFASPKDVDTIWNKGTRWIPSKDTDDLGRPLVYYSYKDDGLVEVIFSEDIVSRMEITGWVEFNFLHVDVEKKILYQGEELDYLEVKEGEPFKYLIRYKMDEGSESEHTSHIEDFFDRRLEINWGTAKVYDQYGDDYTSQLKTGDGHGISLFPTLDKDKTDHRGKIITIEVDAKIREDVEFNEEIPNVANISLGSNHRQSNEVVVKKVKDDLIVPPIKKDVEGKEHLEVAHEEAYSYNVKTDIPSELGGYKDLTITDVLDNRLNVLGATVLVDGKESDFEATIKGETVKLTLDRDALETVKGKEINLQITASIKTGTDIELVDNKATIKLNDNPEVESNVVTVIPPKPTTPDIAKDVEGTDHLEVAHEEAYNYNVKTDIPSELGGYKDLTITDVLDNRLNVLGATVLVDGEESDFEATIKGQTVKLTLDRDALETVKGKEINLQITASIKTGTDIELIDNKATIKLNDNPEVESNVVTVIPPKPSVPVPVEPEQPNKPSEPNVPVEPEQPEKPVTNKEGINVQKTEKVEKNVPVKGKKLPNTATNVFNYLLLGIGLVLIGGVFYYVRKRKNEE